MTKVPKTHHCQRCSRDFARLEHLQRHERSHTKEKPFRCTRCTKAFTRKDLLRRHDRLAHPSETDDPATSETNTSTTQASAFPLEPSIHSADLEAPEISAIPLDGFMLASQGPGPLGSRELGLEDIPFADGGQFDDFTSFMDSVPIPDHVFSLSYQPIPTLLSDGRDALATSSYAGTLPETEWPAQSRIRVSTSDSASGLSTYGSRLPSLQPEGGPSPPPETPRRPRPKSNNHLSISIQERERMLRELEDFPSCVSVDFVLPSKHALSRFVSAYFNVFNEHYPFLHVPTVRVGAMRIELILAIAAVGARYSREPDASNQLFHLAKDVALERFRRRRDPDATACNRDEMSDRDDTGTEDNSAVSVDSGDRRYATVETIQAMVLLIAIGIWFRTEPDLYEALSIRSILDSLVREDNLAYDWTLQPHSWHDWVRYETLKRTKLVVFCFFNIHTITFDMPPMMLSDELRMHPPCAENQWKAASEQEWFGLASGDIFSPLEDLTAVLDKLFESHVAGSMPASDAEQDASNGTPRTPTQGFSSLGGCVLMHAIIQRIWLVRNSGFPCRQRQQLSPESMMAFERALKRWSLSWESGRESSMDPLSPHGPMSFTSTALLRLAYIRINMDLGPIRSLGSWDPDTIARSLDSSPPAQRSQRLTRAALHCAHALSIPVKLGINYVAQTQVVYWSVQHALCSLECAVLLAKWLEVVTVSNPDPPLNAAESRTMHFVVQLVAEANHSGQVDRLRGNEGCLSSSVVRLWASLYRAESVWEMVDLIARSLNAFAGLLEARSRGLGSW